MRTIVHVLASTMSGTVLSLAFAPINNLFAIPVALSIFLFVIEKTLKQDSYTVSFLVGFTFGMGHFTSNLYWISYPLYVDYNTYGWLIPIVIVIVPSLLSIFIGLLAVIMSQFMRATYSHSKSIMVTERVFVIITFSSLWTLMELVRSYAILPFPWNLLGYASIASLPLAQISSLTGVHGLSFLLALAGSIFYSKDIKSVSIVYIMVFCCCIWGEMRLVKNKNNFEGSINIRIVQNNLNIAEHYLMDPIQRAKHLEHILWLSSKDKLLQEQLVIWPESGFPFLIGKRNKYVPELDRLISKGSFVITGADRYDQNGLEGYNSMIAVDFMGDIVSSYDKQILAPFGEYIPMHSVLKNFFPSVITGDAGFKSGSGNGNLEVLYKDKLVKIAPYICYEIIFSPFILNNVKADSTFMLNLTNDGWLGDSIGLYQHFVMARMRAIEYGIPLVRAAATGISAVVDGYGRILSQSNIAEAVVLDSVVPVRQKQTLYLWLYPQIPQLLILLFAASVMILLVRQRVLELGIRRSLDNIGYSENGIPDW
ncbi:Apolipoprotein N-acyltransferase [Alphaproteobacteria bacterium]